MKFFFLIKNIMIITHFKRKHVFDVIITLPIVTTYWHQLYQLVLIKHIHSQIYIPPSLIKYINIFYELKIRKGTSIVF